MNLWTWTSSVTEMNGVENDQMGIKHICNNYKHTYKSHSYVTRSFTHIRQEETQTYRTLIVGEKVQYTCQSLTWDWIMCQVKFYFISFTCRFKSQVVRGWECVKNAWLVVSLVQQLTIEFLVLSKDITQVTSVYFVLEHKGK